MSRGSSLRAFGSTGASTLLGVLLVTGCSAQHPVSDAIDDFTYQLQNIDLGAIGATRFDLVVIDYSADGSEEQRFDAGQIAALKDSPGGHKTVLAYLSIGEAEDYRWYWQESWDADHDGTPDPGAPGWLGTTNPDWLGNYEVRYWDQDWQTIVFAYLDKTIAAGFDGVYLDIVDAFEYWGPGGESGQNRATAESEMVGLVKAIADRARTTGGKPGFLVFPQTGEHLAAHADYLRAVSGIGREDVWFNGDTPNPQPEVDPVLADLDLFKQAGKPVLVMDYVRQPDLIDDFYARATARGYVPYATVRDLDSLVTNPGHEPD
jgi:cysteinyl-tRNA synthetase